MRVLLLEITLIYFLVHIDHNSHTFYYYTSEEMLRKATYAGSMQKENKQTHISDISILLPLNSEKHYLHHG